MIIVLDGGSAPPGVFPPGFFPPMDGGSPGGGKPYSFEMNEGRTSTPGTGPSAGVGGSGAYAFAESSDKPPGSLFQALYNGTACSDTGLDILVVDFYYHMYGEGIGTLSVTNAAGEVKWSLSGNQGDSWQTATVAVNSPSFAFKYFLSDSPKDFFGDAAFAGVVVTCGLVPPPPDRKSVV